MQEEKSPIGNFAERLEALMKNNDLNGKKLAAALGVTPTAVTRYKQGRIPGAEELLKLAKILHVSPYWLVSGRGSKSGPEGHARMAFEFGLLAKDRYPGSIKEQERYLDRLYQAVGHVIETMSEREQRITLEGSSWQERAETAENKLSGIKKALRALEGKI